MNALPSTVFSRFPWCLTERLLQYKQNFHMIQASLQNYTSSRANFSRDGERALPRATWILNWSVIQLQLDTVQKVSEGLQTFTFMERNLCVPTDAQRIILLWSKWHGEEVIFTGEGDYQWIWVQFRERLCNLRQIRNSPRDTVFVRQAWDWNLEQFKFVESMESDTSLQQMDCIGDETSPREGKLRFCVLTCLKILI